MNLLAVIDRLSPDVLIVAGAAVVLVVKVASLLDAREPEPLRRKRMLGPGPKPR